MVKLHDSSSDQKCVIGLQCRTAGPRHFALTNNSLCGFRGRCEALPHTVDLQQLPCLVCPLYGCCPNLPAGFRDHMATTLGIIMTTTSGAWSHRMIDCHHIPQLV